MLSMYSAVQAAKSKISMEVLRSSCSRMAPEREEDRNQDSSMVFEPSSSSNRTGAQLGGILSQIEEDAIPVRFPMADVPLRFQHITSYSWLKTDDKPTILLPGTPPSWCPYSPPEQFSSDYGNVYADENATLLPHYPLEPVFRALQLLAPTQTVSDMDLITCETTIEKLLRFVMHEGEEPYRFDVEIVGETAIFTRMGEESAKSASDYTGYRTSLPEKQTRGNTGENQLQSHYRIAKCTLDDVKCLLRFKGQACIPREDQAYSPGVHTQDESEDPGAFHSIPTFPGSGEHSPLEVRFGGEEIPQRMMAHIKTGNEFESDSIFRDMNTLRLWLSNTTTVVSTHGEQRLFRNVEVENFEIMNLHWELVHKFYIVKLASLIRMIIKTAKDISGGKCWVNVAGSLGLFVMAPTREMGLMSLPPDIKEVMFGIPDRWKPTSPGYVGPTNVESRTGHSRYSPPFMADSNFDLRGVHRFDQNSPI